MPNFVAIGMEVAENVVLPPQLQSASLEQILYKWDDIYHMQHRGENIGHKTIEKLSSTSYRIVIRDLYPDDLSYGVAYGFCRRFLPQGTHFTVSYEDLDKRRDDGTSDDTVLLIEWE